MEDVTAKVVGMEDYVSKNKPRLNIVKRNKNRVVKKSKSLNREKLEEVTRMLDEERVTYEIKTKFHLKIGDVNYFPGKGTIYLDGDFERLEEKGIEALKQVLKEYEIM